MSTILLTRELNVRFLLVAQIEKFSA